MAVNPKFDGSLKAAVPAGKKVVLLCRSGARSVAAAKRAAELDIEAYNILEGFEGDPPQWAGAARRCGWLTFQGFAMASVVCAACVRNIR